MSKMQIGDSKLRLVVLESAKDLGTKIDEHLLDMYHLDKNRYTFIVPINEVFFQDGHLKVEINETVRGKDVFFLTDIGNYSLTYNMHGFTNHVSPNDLLIQLKDGIGACNCHADKINIVMPLLYAGRQHRKNGRENLACGATLREFESIRNLRSFITFDAHDEGVEHAIRNVEFENIYATSTILSTFIKDLDVDILRNIVFVAPDNGATGRRNVYLNSFNSEFINKQAGSFIKQRDYNHLENGKYPVINHEYCGNDNLEGMSAIIIDDMISSGGSMFDCIESLHEKNVKHIYIICTYALFTRGIEKFQEYYDKGLVDGVYTTNLSYIPEEYQNNSWLHVCDCSTLVAEVIYSISNDLSITNILSDKSKPLSLIRDKFKGERR